jgi:hypothetical protein
VSGSLELSSGSRIVLSGVDWKVESMEPHTGRVVLRCPGRGDLVTTVRELVNHPDCHLASTLGPVLATSRGRQPGGLGDLTEHQRDVVAMRYAHLMEAETGYRSGSPVRPQLGEPQPAYDPATTMLRDRRRAKVAELKDLPADEARLLGVERVSERTLERWAAACRRFGPFGCANGSWVRRSGGHPSITEEVRGAIFAVRAESLHRSRVSMKTRERLIHQYVAEKYGPDIPLPCSETLRTVWIEWFGRNSARQRYERSAAQVQVTGGHVVVHRPGQVVALDTTQLAVLVREDVFGEPTAVQLTLALDVYTHSLVAFRLTLVSDTAVDVAMVLRDVMMPLPLRPDWGPELEWPYPGIPAAVVAEFAGHKVAALPFFRPETVTTDHGTVYKNHRLVDVQRVIGANILPARVLRPTDKQAVERAFGAIQSLLLEMLPGYRGVDVADRGADPEGDAVLTIAETEHLIATWIVKVWQNRALGEHAPAWDPGGRHSPNTLFAAAMAQGGFAMQVPSPWLYYELLPAHQLKMHGSRGVKVKGLWYDDPVLDDYRDSRSARGGRFKGEWLIRHDPRDRRYAYFQDPQSHEWHTLRWTGLPEEGEVPSFGDARVAELLRAARQAGLTPKTDAELLPLLLELIGGHIPVSAWPTQLPKASRTGHARETLQGQAAGTDRLPGRGSTGVQDTGTATTPARTTTAAPLRWRGRASQAADAVDTERRRRRERVMTDRPTAVPPRLGDGLRRNSPFLLVQDDPADDGPSTTSDADAAR